MEASVVVRARPSYYIVVLLLRGAAASRNGRLRNFSFASFAIARISPTVCMRGNALPTSPSANPPAFSSPPPWFGSSRKDTRIARREDFLRHEHATPETLVPPRERKHVHASLAPPMTSCADCSKSFPAKGRRPPERTVAVVADRGEREVELGSADEDRAENAPLGPP